MHAVKKEKSSALAGFVTLLRLVDDVDAALAAHQAIVAMAKRITSLVYPDAPKSEE